MYVNDLHILYYIAFGIIGLIIGQIVGNYNEKTIEIKMQEKSKKIKKEQEDQKSKPHYLSMIATAIIYIILLYSIGLEKGLIKNLELFQYLILTPFLISTIVIDKKLQIVPNRLVLTMFEIGIIFIFIYGMYDINIAFDRITGGFVGIGIFLIITLIGRLLSNQEAIGFGDVKLVGTLGLYFGMIPVMGLSVIAFIIGAITSIILILIKRKSFNEYIAFGPFIAISSFTLMVISFNTILDVILNVM